MKTHSAAVLKREPAEHHCSCGCGTGTSTSCHLDCLERPRFFCGQLLTDKDLSDLVGWTQDKMRLARYRGGWGVACGLEVHCDPKRQGWLIVTAGYAVSCCGDDIVVCADAAVDVRGFCGEADDPCGELRRKEDKVAVDVDTAPFQGARPEEVRAIDLFVRYREALTDPQTALGRGVCKEAAECEYGRVRESYVLEPRLVVVSGGDPVAAEAERWQETYEACTEVIDAFRKYFPEAANAKPAEIRRWLVGWIEEHPLHEFCWVRDWICEMPDETFLKEPTLVEILFWIVQDCRNAFLGCACFHCEDVGVPLARVWLRSREHNDRRECTVLGIDAARPYRRPIAPECWPAPLGRINVGQAIWKRPGDAGSTLTDLGLHVRAEAFTLPGNVAELRQRLGRSLWVPYGSSVHAQVYDAKLLGQRVVGFWVGNGDFRAVDRVDAPALAVNDDLTEISEVGEGRARTLNDHGITSYEQLADTPYERLREIFPRLGESVLRQWLTDARGLAEQRSGGGH
jgi:hypothetical protein